jgi:hypothetical protein
MPYYDVTFIHTSCIEADSEDDAKKQLVESVRDNAVADECDAAEISEADYNEYWYRYYLD